jgi:hypothetical protein
MYLNDSQIEDMAGAAVNAYEVAADWNAAIRAAREYAIDEFGVNPSKGAVLLAVKLAKVRWIAISQGVRQQLLA